MWSISLFHSLKINPNVTQNVEQKKTKKREKNNSLAVILFRVKVTELGVFSFKVV